MSMKNEPINIATQAVIIAGGKGTRLAPFTNTMPKPMYEIDGKPFIDRLIMKD